MRASVQLDGDLLAQAEELAARTHRTVTAVIEEALRDNLARQGQAVSKRFARLPTFKGRGVRPGIDLDRTSALLDLTD
jgi:hypothetical protein